MSNIILTADNLAREIDNLLASYPELADDEELRADMLEGETDLHNVLTRIVKTRQFAKANADAIKAMMADLDERKARYERKVEAMNSLAQRLIEHAELRKVELPIATISLRNVPPSVVIDDEDALPETCFETKRVLSRTLIKTALQEGDVPGAHMSNGSTGLTVRVK